MKTKILTALAAAGLALAAPALAPQALAQEPLKMGFAAEPYPPFASLDSSGEWVGFEIDLSRLLCERIGRECVLTPVAWDGIIPALTGGQIDMIMGSMSITDKRKEQIDFSARYYQTPAAIIGAESTEWTGPESLSGATIGVQTATIHADYASQVLGAHNPDIRIYDTQDAANADLASGRLDFVLADSVALDAFLDSSDGEGIEVKALMEPHPIFGEGVGVGLRKEDDELEAALNKAIVEVLNDGSYDELARKYFDFDVYGGPRPTN